MKKPDEIYQSVLDAGDAEEALKALKPKHWLRLYGWLLRTYCENEPSGEILGMMMVIAAGRYAKALKKRVKIREVMG